MSDADLGETFNTTFTKLKRRFDRKASAFIEFKQATVFKKKKTSRFVRATRTCQHVAREDDCYLFGPRRRLLSLRV